MFFDEYRNKLDEENMSEFISAYPDTADSVKKATEALSETIKSFTISLTDFANALIETADNITRQIQSYPNRKVVHLALHGKTERIRKKNLKRIFKDLKFK